MKVLNLYSGIGGNRKLWTGCKVTAVENRVDIANAYMDLFPKDEIVIGDAHKYLIDNYLEFDFIWSSPPCQSHSRARFYLGVKNKKAKPLYLDSSLYEEIVFLKHHFNGLWVVENVVPYYTPLINPDTAISRHLFWCNFSITQFSFKTNIKIRHTSIKDIASAYGYDDLSQYTIKNKRQVLRNCVNPHLGLSIFKDAEKCFMDIGEKYA